MLTSIIICAYNQPAELKLVLTALNEQQNKNFEVVVADDGSTDSTLKMLLACRDTLHYELKHVWQEDAGFRLATIRNKAVAASGGKYLIFLDGDCVPLPSFLEQHLKLQERGWFIRGNRIMLSRTFTQEVLQENLLIHHYSKFTWLKHRAKFNISRFLPLLHMPMGRLRKTRATDWVGVKGCNLGVWREDFKLVNGFDDRCVGWGREDADFAVRLINNGISRKEGNFATGVLHLWHPLASRSQCEKNDHFMQQHIVNKTKRAENGYSSHCTEKLF